MADYMRSSTKVPETIFVWGASGHALVVIDILQRTGLYTIHGLLDNINPERKGALFAGHLILGGVEQLDLLYERGVRRCIFGFGNCKARLALLDEVSDRGFQLVDAIHPSAVIAGDSFIGAGTVVAAGAVINPGARLGRSVIVNTCASIDHESVVEDAVHIAPGVHVAGNVRIGRGTWIGIGATVIDHVEIGAGVIVGAGAVVVNDIPDGVVAYGVPARVVRKA